MMNVSEHEVNTLRLKLIAGLVDTIGYDTVYYDSTSYVTKPILDVYTVSEKEWLEELAYTCPFVGGNAVYKARTLWSMYEADAKYDDRMLCMNAQNKGGDKISDIDSFLNNQLKETIQTNAMTIGSQPIIKANTLALRDGEVNVYPNPATTQLNIEYKCNTAGEFVLYNHVGQIVMRTELEAGNKKVSMLTNELAVGVYTYKCSFVGCEQQTGKITLIK
jgi:hypothetical protein